MQANSDPAAPSHLAGLLLIAVVVAALASLAVIQEARQRGEVLDLVTVSPSFTPADGERARIRWRQRRSSTDAVVRIIDRGRPVRTLADGEPLAGGDRFHVFRWDGSTDSGSVADPGTYKLEILLRDQDREIVPGQGKVRLREAAGQGKEN